MSRRRNAGRPRGWRDQRRASAPAHQKSEPGRELFANPADDSEMWAWISYKTFMTVSTRNSTSGLSPGLLRCIEIHEEVLRPYPNSVITHYNLGDLYWVAARLEDAMGEYEMALRLAPRLGGAHTRVAICLLGLGEVELAKSRLERACRMPHLTSGNEMLIAEAHILLGHHHEGWRLTWLLARHQPNRMAEIVARHVRGPLWDGRPLDGPLLIAGCDGYGDEIMLARYVPQARRRVRSLTILVSDPLVPLFRGQFEGVTVMGRSAPPDPRQFPSWLPMMCLPSQIGIQRAKDIPLTPYLHAPGSFRPLAGAFKVGIRWAGDPGNAHDLMRSTHLTQWVDLLSVHGATFYSFQFQAAAAQLREPVGAEIVDLVPDLGDWGQTAAALSQMDLVIAVDCSLAHLAGALNLPVWIPLQAAVEWRWGLESPTTPWYPSARLFRQRRVNEWEPVFSQMAAELRELVARRRVEAA